MYQQCWKAKLESAYSFMLTYYKITLWQVSKQDRKVFQFQRLCNELQILQLLNDCLMTAWGLPDNCLMTALWQSDDCLTISCKLPDNCLMHSLKWQHVLSRLFSRGWQYQNYSWGISCCTLGTRFNLICLFQKILNIPYS